MTPLEQGPLADQLTAALHADETRMRRLEICRAVLGADAWIGAGFLRNLTCRKTAKQPLKID